MVHLPFSLIMPTQSIQKDLAQLLWPYMPSVYYTQKGAYLIWATARPLDARFFGPGKTREFKNCTS